MNMFIIKNNITVILSCPSFNIPQKFLSNFIEDSEWPLIIDEADPYYLSDGATLGLRNVHVFALSNVLKRPILLLGTDFYLILSLNLFKY